MRFSIIIPVYNAEPFLSKCIESLLNQTFQDFEVVLIDDGSTDHSGRIIDEYGNHYSEKIKAYHKENGGQFSARLKGIELSLGDYLISLDADDCLRKDALEIIARYITNAHNPDILFHKTSVCEDYIGSLVEYPFSDGKVFEGCSLQRLYEELIATPNLNSFWGKAYKSSLLKKVHWDINSISSVRNGEDLLQVLPVFTKAKRVVYCDHVLYFYRQTENSITHKYSPTFFHSRKILHAELSKYIELWQMDQKIFGEILDKRILKEMISVMINAIWADKRTCKDKISEICNDNWFRNLYRRTDKKAISYKGRAVLALAYCKLTTITYFIMKWLA